MLLELEKISVPPGHKVLLEKIPWKKFETILEELGEHRSARIAYENNILEIMTPFPEHESNKEILSDLIKDLLEELNIDFYSLGSTTFKNEQMAKGIEPDNCFYLQNEAKVRGKKRLNLNIDPPPDLALEIDVTSRTHLPIYAALGVPELWRFEEGKLQINVLRVQTYIEVEFSPTFPDLPLKNVIPQYLEQVKLKGRNKTIKAFRAWVRRYIKSE